jgi:dolichol kinase
MNKKDDKNKYISNNEQINVLRNQIQNAKSVWQNKTQSAIENAKSNFFEITNKINSDIKNIKTNVAELENELIEIQNNVADHNISFLQELLRKSIHLMSLSIPICYMFFTKENLLMVLIPLMICVVCADIITRKNSFVRNIYLKLFGFMLRKHEIQNQEILLNGASWVMISSVLTIYFFPQIVAIISLSILFISDIVAAIMGRRFGKKQFLGLNKKTWAGTLAFAISAFIVSAIYGFIFEHPIQFFVIAICASTFAAFCEAISNEVLHTDDNLTIPISFGIAMWLGNAYLNYFFCINLF